MILSAGVVRHAKRSEAKPGGPKGRIRGISDRILAHRAGIGRRPARYGVRCFKGEFSKSLIQN
jgi:hypothetical protein